MPAIIRPVRIVEPATSALDLSQVKLALRAAGGADDLLIQQTMAGVVAAWDGWGGELNRCLITQTWRQTLPEFPCSGEIALCLPDVVSVVVKYLDAASAEQTLSAASYLLTNGVEGAAITLLSGFAWPTTASRPDAVRVEITAGFGPTPADLPADLKAGLGDMVAMSYFAAGRDHRIRSEQVPGVQTVEWFGSGPGGAAMVPPRAAAALQRWRWDRP